MTTATTAAAGDTPVPTASETVPFVHVDDWDIPGTEVMRDHDGLHFQRDGGQV